MTELVVSSFECLAFYRGVSSKYATDKVSLLVPRQDRRPKNSSMHFHEIADHWFNSRFGVPYRSKGLFLTSRRVSASTYAQTPDHVMRVVPLSQYRYCWSPAVSDLLFVATKMVESTVADIETYLDSVNYQESNLEEAHDVGHEVMLYCEQYVAIPIGLLGITPEPTPRTIILPNYGKS